MKPKTWRVMITGYSKKEFLKLEKKKRNEGCCYWCRKREGEESVFRAINGFGVEKTVLLPFVQRWKKVEMLYFICRECFIGFAGLIKAIEKDRTVIEKS